MAEGGNCTVCMVHLCTVQYLFCTGFVNCTGCDLYRVRSVYTGCVLVGGAPLWY